MSKPKAITNKGIIIFKDYELLFNFLTDKEAGKVLKKLLENFDNGKLNKCKNFESEKIKNVYMYISNRINDYLEKSQKAKEIGALGGNPTLNPTLKGEDNLKEKKIKEEKRRKKEEEKKTETKDFNIFYSSYPRKEAKNNAYKAYIKAIKGGADKDTILKGLNRYIAYIQTNKIERQYIKMPATWLNQGCWEDEYKNQSETSSVNNDKTKLLKLANQIMERRENEQKRIY